MANYSHLTKIEIAFLFLILDSSDERCEERDSTRRYKQL